MSIGLISVVIPVYNTPKDKLTYCMSSVMSQTYSNLEIIIVDDGSKKDIADEADRYAQKDKRIKVVHTKNLGLSLARSNGISVSKGDYIFFLDSDDVISLNAIECLAEAIQSTKSDMALGRLSVISEYPKLSASETDYSIKSYNSMEALEHLITCNGIGSTACCRLAKKEVWGKQPFLPGRLHEDLASMWEVFERCEKIVVCDKDLYFYYHGDQSSIHNKKNSKKFCVDFWKAFYERHKTLLKRYPQMNSAERFSCLIYCPQIWSAIYNSDCKDELKGLSSKCINLFKSSWNEGKKYAGKHSLKWRKYILFRISPKIYYSVYSAWRKIRGIRK